MKQKVLNAVSYFRLLDGAHEVTVALSGGADSMALLYALYDFKDTCGFKLSAAHFNHKIRGDEAERDEAFVRNECNKLGVELFCDHADVPLYAKENNLSLELAARKLRYDFLASVSKGLVATAHTASDNLETILFNLSRGTGIKGLCGIPAKRDIFIRPLIFCSREDIEKYCEENAIPYVTDSSNLSDDYSRNKLRHKAVPTLKEINPSAEAAATRLSLLLSEDCDFLDSKAESEYAFRKLNEQLNIAEFDKLHPAIAKRVIKLFYEERLDLAAESLHINQIFDLCASGGKISLPGNNSAAADNGILRIFSNENIVLDAEFSVIIKECDNDLFKNSQKINNLFLKNTIDCDKIVGKSVLRVREPKDSMKINGCTKSLKKLCTEYSIPLEHRKNLPVISDDEGVIWVYGIGAAQRVKVTAQSKHILKIEAIKQT